MSTTSLTGSLTKNGSQENLTNMRLISPPNLLRSSPSPAIGVHVDYDGRDYRFGGMRYEPQRLNYDYFSAHGTGAKQQRSPRQPASSSSSSSSSTHAPRTPSRAIPIPSQQQSSEPATVFSFDDGHAHSFPAR